MRRAVLRRAAVGLAGAVVLSGCGITHMQDLSFRVDNRLHFVSPKQRAKTHQPVTVSWRISGFRIAAVGSEPPSRDAGYFAVFVDRAPVTPGQTLRAVASGDRTCIHDLKCPDAAYLSAHQVYTATTTSITLPQIPNLVGSKEKVQHHTVTVVLMDTAGHRIGESAWQLDIRLPRVGFA